MSPRNGRLLPDRRLAALLTVCCLFVLLSSFPFQTYVMPHLDDEHLSLAERIKSGKFADSYGYGKYAMARPQFGLVFQPYLSCKISFTLAGASNLTYEECELLISQSIKLIGFDSGTNDASLSRDIQIIVGRSTSDITAIKVTKSKIE